MRLEQAVINETARRHLQITHTDLAGLPFVECRCGRLFDTQDEATAHWWRSVRALQRHRERAAA